MSDFRVEAKSYAVEPIAPYSGKRTRPEASQEGWRRRRENAARYEAMISHEIEPDVIYFYYAEAAS